MLNSPFIQSFVFKTRLWYLILSYPKPQKIKYLTLDRELRFEGNIRQHFFSLNMFCAPRSIHFWWNIDPVFFCVYAHQHKRVSSNKWSAFHRRIKQKKNVINSIISDDQLNLFSNVGKLAFDLITGSSTLATFVLSISATHIILKCPRTQHQNYARCLNYFAMT